MSAVHPGPLRRGAGVLLFLVCVALYGPALKAGFLADDLFQISMLEGRHGTDHPLDLYAFAKQDSAATRAHLERGTLPWWTVDDFRFAMFRPVSSLFIWIDHRLFPRLAWIHHLHSMVWFFLALLVGHRLLSRLFGYWIALGAVSLWAIDETMVWMVGWLANRCSLISAVFCLIALRLHLVRRSAPSVGKLWLELGAWSLAFGGGEYALCGVAYLIGFELVAAPGGWRRRLFELWPAALPMAIWATTWLVGGYGVYGANTYIDPVHDFGAFVDSLGHRIPRMIGEVWLNLAGEGERFVYRYRETILVDWFVPQDGSDLVTQAHRQGRFGLIASALVVTTGWWLARPVLDAEQRRHAAWLTLGSLLSLIPLAAVAPSTRSLIYPNLGPAVVVTLGGAAAWRSWCSGSMRRRTVGLCIWLAGMLYIHGFREGQYAVEQMGQMLKARDAYTTFYGHPSFERLDVEGKHVVVLATPGLVTGIHGAAMLALLERPLPKTWHVLAMEQKPYLVRRLGPHELELASVGGPLHRSPQGSLFRSKEDALTKGDRVDVGLFEAEVLHERPGQGPDSVLFRFEMPLDDPRLIFLEVTPEGLVPFDLPPTGRTIALRPPELPKVMPRG